MTDNNIETAMCLEMTEGEGEDSHNDGPTRTK